MYAIMIRMLVIAAIVSSFVFPVSAAVHEANPMEGLLYGVKHAHSGGTIHCGGSGIVIPDEYRIIDVNRARERLYVCACFQSGPDGSFRSELWMFRIECGANEIAFKDRQVLASYELLGGERLNLCRNTVNCNSAVALFVQQWEHGSTRVFDVEGREAEVDWPDKKTDNEEHRNIDTIRPIGLIHGRPRGGRLACMAYEHGDDDPYVLLYSLDTGEIELGPLNLVMGEVGIDLFAGFSNGHW